MVGMDAGPRPRSVVAAAATVLGLLAAIPLDWLAPPSCAACDAEVPPGRVFCAPCAATVVRLPLAACGPAGSLAPFAFGGAVAEAVRRFKYGARPDLARPLGHLLRAAVQDAGLRAVVVVQVPLHPRRRAERGYDQAGLLARHVAAALDRPHRPGALWRIRHGAAQASLGREDRRSNPALAFEGDPRRLRGAQVLLVDDVITTGATVRACRDALLAAGAASPIVILGLARAEAPEGAPP